MMTRLTLWQRRNAHSISTRSTRWLAAAVVACVVSLVAPTAQVTVTPELTPLEITTRDDRLSEADARLYRQIDVAQKHADFSAADALMAELSNRHLVGYVLAERYLSPHYTASAEELKQWVSLYADHPQASRLMQLAARRGVDVDVTIARNALQGDGYTDHLGRSSMPDRWFRALALWREKNYTAAQPLFRGLAADESLSDWQRAAAYYWAYRTAETLGDSRAADLAVRRAASYPTTFYGLLALQTLGEPMPRAEAPEVSSSLRHDARTIRASLLAALGRTEDAEQELRALYSNAYKTDRAGVVTLASELGLANLQLRLAHIPELSAAERLFASYPVPSLVVHAQDAVDPALLLAVVRNESAFQPRAGSEQGARGMMQMLPSTARAVERSIGTTLASNDPGSTVTERLNDPTTSVRLGAHYLALLQREPAIGNNTVRVLAGYNAGPGAVASWATLSRTVEDPLLYIEMIPYAETRNYVMQVMAQYWMYQHMLGQSPASLAALETGNWPQA